MDMMVSTDGAIRSSPDSQPSSDFVLLAKSSNVHVIFNILSTICFKKDQLVTVILRKNGIKFTVEESRSVQGNTFLNLEIWQEYHYKTSHLNPSHLLEDEEDRFTVNLSVLLECLNIYGPSNQLHSLPITVQIAYQGYGSPLLIMLENHDVLTDCSIRTLEAQPLLVFNIKSAEILCKLIVKSENLREAFQELDWNNSSNHRCVWLISNEHPYFRLSTDGTGSSCQVDYPRESEAFEEFDCVGTCEFSYKMKHLQTIAKALQVAQKTQIRINEDGLLAMEHRLQNEDSTVSFVGFYLAPMYYEEEEHAFPSHSSKMTPRRIHSSGY